MPEVKKFITYMFSSNIFQTFNDKNIHISDPPVSRELKFIRTISYNISRELFKFPWVTQDYFCKNDETLFFFFKISKYYSDSSWKAVRPKELTETNVNCFAIYMPVRSNCPWIHKKSYKKLPGIGEKQQENNICK